MLELDLKMYRAMIYGLYDHSILQQLVMSIINIIFLNKNPNFENKTVLNV